MTVPLAGLAIIVVLRGLARWLVRNRDSTSIVMLAEAQPTKVASLMMGNLRVMTGWQADWAKALDNQRARGLLRRLVAPQRSDVLDRRNVITAYNVWPSIVKCAMPDPPR